jgi:hypothetical protein
MAQHSELESNRNTSSTRVFSKYMKYRVSLEQKSGCVGI